MIMEVFAQLTQKSLINLFQLEITVLMQSQKMRVLKLPQVWVKFKPRCTFSIGLENLSNLNLHKNHLRKLHNFYVMSLKNKKIKFLNLKGKRITPVI